jgi:predicted anti-sigma-YlaC factor YlaD
MKRLCNLFNRHRDGMLNSEQAMQFESHLAACDQCRPRLFLLNNMAHAIRNQDMPDPIVPPETVAARALEQSRSWDVFLLFWLKPLPAWSGLAVLLVLVTFLWIAPWAKQQSLSNYEDFISSGDQAGSAAIDLSDANLESWLEKGGSLQ